ncbi:MAG: hypothetical protein JW697_07060 [Kosmotogaceae bacterium]|nr:hypothetical protein [Kosmotogaceae bacterium]
MKKMKMKSWVARIVALSVLLIAFGMASLAQEDATILLPADVNITVENENENATIEVVPLTNTRQVLVLSGTDPSIFDRGLFPKSTTGYVSNSDYTASMNAFLSGNETATYPSGKVATIGLVHLASNR